MAEFWTINGLIFSSIQDVAFTEGTSFNLTLNRRDFAIFRKDFYPWGSQFGWELRKIQGDPRDKSTWQDKLVLTNCFVAIFTQHDKEVADFEIIVTLPCAYTSKIETSVGMFPNRAISKMQGTFQRYTTKTTLLESLEYTGLMERWYEEYQ